MFYSTFCFKAYEEYLSMIVNGHVYYVRQRICSAFSIVAYRDMLKLNAGHSSAQLQRERERIPTFILHHECGVRRKGWYLSLVWQFHIMMVNGAWSDFCKQRNLEVFSIVQSVASLDPSVMLKNKIIIIGVFS